MHEYHVYSMTNGARTLYIGVTNDLAHRMYEHKQKLTGVFTKKHNISMLFYYESTSSIEAALTREKQLKGWLRNKKMSLIEMMNPKWIDLSAEWYD